MQRLTLERIGKVDVHRRASWLLSTKLWLWLKLRALRHRVLRWCAVVHVHIVKVIEGTDLVRRLPTEQRRCVQLHRLVV